jgi:hypothetical protein
MVVELRLNPDKLDLTRNAMFRQLSVEAAVGVEAVAHVADRYRGLEASALLEAHQPLFEISE